VRTEKGSSIPNVDYVPIPHCLAGQVHESLMDDTEDEEEFEYAAKNSGSAYNFKKSPYFKTVIFRD